MGFPAPWPLPVMPSGEHFFEGLITRMCAKPFRALTPAPLVCRGGEAAMTKNQKARWLGDGFWERIISTRTWRIGTKKKKQPTRTASLNRPSDIAIQVNAGRADLSVAIGFHIVSQRSSTPIS